MGNRKCGEGKGGRSYFPNNNVTTSHAPCTESEQLNIELGRLFVSFSKMPKQPWENYCNCARKFKIKLSRLFVNFLKTNSTPTSISRCLSFCLFCFLCKHNHSYHTQTETHIRPDTLVAGSLAFWPFTTIEPYFLKGLFCLEHSNRLLSPFWDMFLFNPVLFFRHPTPSK